MNILARVLDEMRAFLEVLVNATDEDPRDGQEPGGATDRTSTVRPPSP